ncbi:uncharacterized protein LOC115739552 [Rhodamnia argentea]|uniref:Uncharacterized protein LOC115739552 n=1 Tax=Rhodamnia argentea TaxID=178133 RepID=A0A8B8P152_9MYRT|nr:uncharacterized protein LOC115739552 [Rhodamnia argentea]
MNDSHQPSPSLYRDGKTGEGPKGKLGEGNVRMENARARREAARWRCRKHPKHRQSTGVCSLCLSKKLSRLSSGSYLRGSTGANRRYSCSSSPSSSSSLSSYHSSSESSSCSSPIHRYGRFAHEARSGPVSMLFGGKDGLKKSRSIAFAPKTRAGGDCAGEIIKGEKSKGGFWSKLIPARRKRDGAGGGDLKSLKHSLTQRETVTM